MTENEAIKYLIRPVQTSTVASDEYTKQIEAYRMAIDALEQKAKKKRGIRIVTPGDIDYVIESHGLSDLFNSIPNAKEDALDYAYEHIMSHINRNYFVYITSSKIEKLVAEAVLDMAKKYGYKE